ncbi:hypothetical protein IQ250_10040 [Pseudanabaenaceae cyanobacterium LEGE 13415]|nr:hypothetical protein [Pseudanabaenaceae cyanobacterium LEGE 13415]
MKRFLPFALRSALLGVCSSIAIAGFSPILQPTFAESSQTQSKPRPTPQEFDTISPATACWRLSYSLNSVKYQSQLNLNRDRGTLSTTLTRQNGQPDLKQQTVRVSDVDSDGWIRRQLFFWLNRLQQRKATEQELAQINQQIDRGNLTGTDLERAKQFARSLQALLNSSEPQTAVLTQMKTEAVQRFKQSQQQLEAQAKQSEQTLVQQVEQRRQQVLAALREPNQRRQLEEQLRQINAAIRSGQLRGDQLKQAQQAQRELQQLRDNPNSVEERAKEFQAQQLKEIRSELQRALEQARAELSKQMLMIENRDNILVVVTSTPEDARAREGTVPQAFSLQIRNNQYDARTCNANGECVPITVSPCS